MKRVSVVILNFKVWDLTLKCVESVRKSTYKGIDIIVVDNSPSEGTEISLDKDIFYIANKDNFGYAGGNNVGIKKSLERSCNYIFILNPDAQVERDTIAILVEAMEEYQAGIVCPKIYFEDGKTIWYAGKDFDTSNVLGKHRGVDQEDKGQFDCDSETEANGAAMLVKREVFEKIGFFDERFFLYLDDSDFSFRVKRAGYKIMYIYRAKVLHKNAQSTGLGSPLQDYFFTRNRLLFAAKFLSLRTRFALLRESIRNLLNPVRRLALWDFLIGNFGKGSYLK